MLVAMETFLIFVYILSLSFTSNKCIWFYFGFILINGNNV